MLKNILNKGLIVLVCALASGGVEAQEKSAQPLKNEQPKLEKIKLGTTKNVTQFGDVYLSGQFSEDDIKLLKEAGIKVVISLRAEGEVKWDEDAALKKAGIKSIKVPLKTADALTDDVMNKLRKILNENKENKVMMHCGSANRVGAIWATHRCMDGGLDWQTALNEGKTVGLRSEAYLAKIEDFIERNKKQSAETGNVSTDKTYGYSRDNPILVGGDSDRSGPKAERAYFDALLDKDGKEVSYRRLASDGIGPHGNILDIYQITTSQGEKVKLWIDMYHKDRKPEEQPAPVNFLKKRK